MLGSIYCHVFSNVQIMKSVGSKIDLDASQTRPHNVGPDLDANCLPRGTPKRTFFKYYMNYVLPG